MNSLKSLSLGAINSRPLLGPFTKPLDDDAKLSPQKLLEISKFTHLEKIHFEASVPVEDETILNIIQKCPNLNQIKMGKILCTSV